MKKTARTLEQIEAEMAKLREKKKALHAQLKPLAAERRALILSSQLVSQSGSVVLTPEPIILSAKIN